jgi:HEXXH motif-containing protein
MDRYNRLLDLAAETPTLLAQPSSEQWAPFTCEVASALEMIERADAELAGELRALVIQIVGAVSPTGAGRQFDGASSFMLWGAICINIARHPTALDLVGALVHEATHQLLFGLSREEPLLDNLTDGRFESPLRRDPRPMVGVFHGTFVCARMYYVYRRMLDSRPGLLQAADLDSINQRLDEQRRRFFCGLETVQDHGRLTAAGACLLNSAQEFIEYDTA